MDTTGGSMSDYSRSGSRMKAAPPKTMSRRLTTEASTGRLMDRYDELVLRQPAGYLGLSRAALSEDAWLASVLDANRLGFT
jgi:hypothetical protein